MFAVRVTTLSIAVLAVLYSVAKLYYNSATKNVYHYLSESSSRPISSSLSKNGLGTWIRQRRTILLQHLRITLLSLSDHDKMRLSANACASALLFTLPAVAQNALLYLATPSTADNPPTTLNPSEARLVIAQRLGLSRYHNLNQASDETLQVINSFSSTPDSLFSAHQEENSRQALVIIEGVEKPESQSYMNFQVFETLKTSVQASLTVSVLLL